MMRWIRIGLAGAIGLALVQMPSEADACGGFFCNNVTPVVQSAERILFRINDDHTVTTVVEIQYVGEPQNFGWVLPIAKPIPVESIEVAPAGIFDQLEAATAPVFVRPAADAGAAQSDAGSSCGCPFDGGYDSDWNPPPPDTSGVEVVGDAVVGPFAIEIITAESGDNLVNWLQLNGYQIPFLASEPMDHYVDAGMSFIGVKLQPDVPQGPIESLMFTYEGTVPSIPLLLTAIAATEDMEIVAYVLGGGRYVAGNWIDLQFDYDQVRFDDEGQWPPYEPPGGTTDAGASASGSTGATEGGSGGDIGTPPTATTGGDTTAASTGVQPMPPSIPRPDSNVDETNYTELLVMAVDAEGGRAWNTEFAGTTEALIEDGLGPEAAELVETGAYLTRFHTYISGFEMTSDPHFMPDATAPDVDNVHELPYRKAPAPPHERPRREVPIGALTLMVVPFFVRRRQ